MTLRVKIPSNQSENFNKSRMCVFLSMWITHFKTSVACKIQEHFWEESEKTFLEYNNDTTK